MNQITAIIPAAGRSSRMGTCKSLLPIGETTMIGYQIAQLRSAGVQNIAVATNGNPELHAELANYSVTIANTEGETSSMLETIRFVLNSILDSSAQLRRKTCTLSAAEGHNNDNYSPDKLIGLPESMMILPADHPPTNIELLKKMIDLSKESPDQIVAPIYKGKRGHPIIIPACLYDELLVSFDAVGLRGLLDKYPDRVTTVLALNQDVHLNLNRRIEYNLFNKLFLL